jgi:hypothetical protein
MVDSSMLELFSNLSRFHREHEKFYGEVPLQDASSLLRASRTLKALAEHWRTATPEPAAVPTAYAGAPDLNDERAIESAGVLFMESGEPPAEIERIKRELETRAADAESTGKWLGDAMEVTWSVASQLLEFPQLADLVAERHSIIVHDWQNASLLLLVSRLLRRAADVLGKVDFSVAALRADLAGGRHSANLLFSAAELIDHAVDLGLESSTLVRQNERRWRVFNERVSALAAAQAE